MKNKLEVSAWDEIIQRMARSPSVPWTREHQLIALNLYRKLPFGHFDKGKPIVIQIAGLMGRTPSSLAMKLGNLASLDPVHKARNVKGLSKATKQDRSSWPEYIENLSVLGPESEQLLHDLFTKDDELEIDFLDRKQARLVSPRTFGGEGTESLTFVKVRRGQQFFRQSVLTAYGVSCCITDIKIPKLLVASHIRPWSEFPENRLDPRNGLCLSTLHDSAFDSGLMTLDEDLRVVLSPNLKRFLPQPALELNFLAYEGKQIRLPDKIANPSADFLEHHRNHIYPGGNVG